MTKRLPFCTVLLGCCLLAGPPAVAQAVYRCDNVYSQTPCPGGTTVQTDDSRTLAQKKQADANTNLAAMQAAKMEKERLALEKAATAKPGKPASMVAANKNPRAAGAPTTAKKPKKESEFFTAAAKAPPRTVEKIEKRVEEKPVKP